MREIKFRAFIKSTKEIVDVEWIDFINKQITYHRIDFKGFGLVSTASFEEIELIQYTNLNDRNGKEIYEGDILLFNNSINDRKWKCVVEYREGSFVCVYQNDKVYNHFDSWNVPKVTWEVIGNIYEHPHLLGGDS